MDDYKKKCEYLQATQNEIQEFIDDIKKIDEGEDPKLKQDIINNYEKLNLYFEEKKQEYMLLGEMAQKSQNNDGS